MLLPGTRRTATAAAVVVAAPFVIASSCQTGTAKACDVLHEAQRVEAGQVVGTVRAVCDPPPQSHTLRAELEVRVANTWIGRGRAAVVSVIPDATGFPVEVRAECREGTYRVHVVVEGTGPAPSAVPFRFEDTGPEHTYALVDCAG